METGGGQDHGPLYALFHTDCYFSMLYFILISFFIPFGLSKGIHKKVIINDNDDDDEDDDVNIKIIKHAIR